MGAAPRSRCPISRPLDIVGDRWTLLVIRDLMCGKRRDAELQASLEGIPTNILADHARDGRPGRARRRRCPPASIGRVRAAAPVSTRLFMNGRHEVHLQTVLVAGR
jgi:hypothetical protein